MKVQEDVPGRRTLPIRVQEKSAQVTFSKSLFWLNRASPAKSSGTVADASQASICVPLALVLYCSFIPDSDGGSLLLRLLTPPSTSDRSPLLPFKATKSRAARVAELQHELDGNTSLTAQERLASQLSGPCTNLRLVNIEARFEDVGSIEDAKQWAEDLMQAAYPDVKPYRKLKVLINPIGGPGKALPLFPSRIRPVLEAAGCVFDVEVTKYVNHGLEIARDLSLADGWDAIVCVSGDGMLHEVLNGLAQREDALEALKIPIAPIPTGSGNALALNLLGVGQGFNLALACLNIIKGKEMLLDVCSVTQPADSVDSSTASNAALKASPRKRDTSADIVDGTSAAQMNNIPTLPYNHHYSFLSQAIGLMADVDLGTEDMRSLGDTRFVLGYIGGVLSNKECEVDVYVKLGAAGTLNKKEMRERLKGAERKLLGNGEATSASSLRNGPVTDPLPGIEDLPSIDLRDPSWHSDLIDSISRKSDQQATEADKWYRVSASLSALYAGSIPYVSRDLLQFPFSAPGDNCVDVALQLHGGGRKAKLRAIGTAETGEVVYDGAVVYMKVQAYRVVPRLEAGHKRLKKGGLVSIDGEHWPYRSFQVEVNSAIHLRVLSLYGKWCVPDVPPPASASAAAS